MNTFELLAILFLRAASAYYAAAVLLVIASLISGAKAKVFENKININYKGAAHFAFIVLSFVAWFIKI